MMLKNSLDVCGHGVVGSYAYNSTVTCVNGVLFEVQVTVSKIIVGNCMDVCMGSCGPVLGRKSRLVDGNAETSAGERTEYKVMTSKGPMWTRL